MIGSESLTPLLFAVPTISLLELDLPGHEWEVLALLLDTPGILHNVTQIVAYLQLPAAVTRKLGGQTATTLRSHFSQLQRLHTLGYRLFHSEAVPPPPHHQQQGGGSFNSLQENCCFKVGYVRKTDWYS